TGNGSTGGCGTPESYAPAARLHRWPLWGTFGSTASGWRRPVGMSNAAMWLRSRSMAAFGSSRSPGWRRDVVMPQRPCCYTKILPTPRDDAPASSCPPSPIGEAETLPACGGCAENDLIFLALYRYAWPRLGGVARPVHLR